VNHCIRHFEEPVAGVCRTCQRPFCDRCLVFSFGPRKPPYCVACALNASGVRNGGSKARPAMSFGAGDEAATGTTHATSALDRRTARAERRAAKASARAARKGVTIDPVPTVTDALDAGPHDTFLPLPGQLAGARRYEPAAIEQLV
jgi:hypothetical protein